MKRKKRFCRRLPASKLFTEAHTPHYTKNTQILTLDEFEAIRLCDYEDYSQTSAASHMDVSRATIQRLLSNARYKILTALLHNYELEISNDATNIKLKGENNLNKHLQETVSIGFPSKDKVIINGDIHTMKMIAIYRIVDKEITNVHYVAPPLKEENIPEYFDTLHIDLYMTDILDQETIQQLKTRDIDVILGAHGRIDVTINEYFGGFLTDHGNICQHPVSDHFDR